MTIDDPYIAISVSSTGVTNATPVATVQAAHEHLIGGWLHAIIDIRGLKFARIEPQAAQEAAAK